MKSKRQEEILALIQEQNIETQNQLIEALRKRGVKSTQATLSRDIRELRLVKELSPDGGGLPGQGGVRGDADGQQHHVGECVVSFDTAQNIVVIHTLPGLANAAASMLDNLDVPNLVGTLAGDDTAFLAMRDVGTALDFCREIEAML